MISATPTVPTQPPQPPSGNSSTSTIGTATNAKPSTFSAFLNNKFTNPNQRKFSPKILLGIVALLLLIAGSVAAYFLVLTSQDVRNQASYQGCTGAACIDKCFSYSGPNTGATCQAACTTGICVEDQTCGPTGSYRCKARSECTTHADCTKTNINTFCNPNNNKCRLKIAQGESCAGFGDYACQSGLVCRHNNQGGGDLLCRPPAPGSTPTPPPGATPKPGVNCSAFGSTATPDGLCPYTFKAWKQQ